MWICCSDKKNPIGALIRRNQKIQSFKSSKQTFDPDESLHMNSWS